MMINLSNYEEYFLLYIDNELSKGECEAVELFVRQHPHLAPELDMLQEAKLPLNNAILFTDKTSLYKAENSININNYEEYFILHTDKELSANEEEEVEQFVLHHPQLQETFLLFQNTKLVPEDIECPDKHRLYKRTDRRIIPLYIARIAVAAAVAGVILLVGNLVINNNQPQVAISTPKVEHKPVEKVASLQNEPPVISPEKKSNNAIVANNEVKHAATTQVKSNKITNKVAALPDDNVGSNNEPVIARIDPLQIKQPAPPAPDIAIADDNAAPIHEQPTALKLLDEVDEKEPASTEMFVSNEYASAKPAVYKELNTDDDQTLYVGALQLNKAKVNGLVKKVTHLLGSKNKESNL